MLLAMSECRVIYDADRKRRVTIFESSDGCYSFIEEHFSNEPLEQCWVTQTHRRSICASFEIALREARGRVEWLGGMQDEK
jgi:hypothetical protein